MSLSKVYSNYSSGEKYNNAINSDATKLRFVASVMMVVMENYGKF